MVCGFNYRRLRILLMKEKLSYVPCRWGCSRSNAEQMSSLSKKCFDRVLYFVLSIECDVFLDDYPTIVKL